MRLQFVIEQLHLVSVFLALKLPYRVARESKINSPFCGRVHVVSAQYIHTTGLAAYPSTVLVQFHGSTLKLSGFESPDFRTIRLRVTLGVFSEQQTS